MPRKQKYASDADRQAAYRARKRNTPSVTKCPNCGGSNTQPVSEENAKQFGVYCSVLCFDCNGLVSETGAVWQFAIVPEHAHELPEWMVAK